jgi:hypothetical protein
MYILMKTQNLKTRKTSIIQYPSGRYGFVGAVPEVLAIRTKLGACLTNDEIREYRASSNPGMIMKAKGWKTPAFDTREQAIEFAKNEGVEIV